MRCGQSDIKPAPDHVHKPIAGVRKDAPALGKEVYWRTCDVSIISLKE